MGFGIGNIVGGLVGGLLGKKSKDQEIKSSSEPWSGVQPYLIGKQIRDWQQPQINANWMGRMANLGGGGLPFQNPWQPMSMSNPYMSGLSVYRPGGIPGGGPFGYGWGGALAQPLLSDEMRGRVSGSGGSNTGGSGASQAPWWRWAGNPAFDQSMPLWEDSPLTVGDYNKLRERLFGGSDSYQG